MTEIPLLAARARRADWPRGRPALCKHVTRLGVRHCLCPTGVVAMAAGCSAFVHEQVRCHRGPSQGSSGS